MEMADSRLVFPSRRAGTPLVVHVYAQVQCREEQIIFDNQVLNIHGKLVDTTYIV